MREEMVDVLGRLAKRNIALEKENKELKALLKEGKEFIEELLELAKAAEESQNGG